MKSYESRAHALAKKLGIELVEEDTTYGFALECWSYPAHLTDDPGGQGHTIILHLDMLGTREAVFAEALSWLEELQPCAKDCFCYGETA